MRRRPSSTATPLPPGVQLERIGSLAREALDELRSLILGLRPPELERDGLEGALRKEVEMLRRVHGVEIELVSDGGVDGGDPERELAVLRIVHEALHNALRHARAEHIRVRLQPRRGRGLGRRHRASIPAARSSAHGISA